jgi:hypothetical protein
VAICADAATDPDLLVLGTIFLGVATPTEGGALWARWRIDSDLAKAPVGRHISA